MVQQERAVRTRESLVRAAAEVFAEEGFVSATLSTICGKAGVTKGALHFHFEGKHALAQTVEAVAVDTARRIIREADARPGAPLQRLIDATYGLMRSLDEDVVVQAGFGLAGSAPQGHEAVDLRGEWRRWIDTVLHIAEEEGELAEGVSPTQASTVIAAATVGFEVLGSKDQEWLSRRTLSHYWELMLPRIASPHRLAGLLPHGTGPSAPDLASRRQQTDRERGVEQRLRAGDPAQGE